MKQKTKFKETEIGMIPENWEVKRFGDICTIRRGASPRPIHNFLSTSGIPWVKIADASAQDTRYIEWTKEYITDEGRANTVIVKPGDFIVSNSATPGIPKFMKIDAGIHDGWLLIDPSNNVDKNFLYYLFIYARPALVGIADGTVFKNLKTDIVRNHKISTPPLCEQKKIAKILSDLDSQIELNQKTNKTLEAIGQAIFKKWFIDLEFPGHDNIMFVNGMPEGWRKGKLIEVSDIVMGQSPPGDTYNESGNGAVFYQGNRDFGFRFPSPRVYCTAQTRIAEAGDVLISVRAPVGAINVTLEQCAIGRGVAALRMKQYSNGFLFYFLSTRQDLWNQFNSEGTVFGCLNKTEFHKIVLPIPSDEIMRQFDVVIKPIDKMIQKNELENRALLRIRDSLLPRLMSGKIRVAAEGGDKHGE